MSKDAELEKAYRRYHALKAKVEAGSGSTDNERMQAKVQMTKILKKYPSLLKERRDPKTGKKAKKKTKGVFDSLFDTLSNTNFETVFSTLVKVDKVLEATSSTSLKGEALHRMEQQLSPKSLGILKELRNEMAAKTRTNGRVRVTLDLPEELWKKALTNPQALAFWLIESL